MDLLIDFFGKTQKHLGKSEHSAFGRQRMIKQNVRTTQTPEEDTSKPKVKKEEKTIKEEDLPVAVVRATV